MTGVLKRKICTLTFTQGEGHVKNQGEASINQEIWKTASKTWGETWNRFSLTVPRKSQPWRYISLGLVAFRSMRINFCHLCHPSYGTSYKRPGKLTYSVPTVLCFFQFVLFWGNPGSFLFLEHFSFFFPFIFLPSLLTNFYSFFRSLFHPFFLCKDFLVSTAPHNCKEPLWCAPVEHYITFHAIITNYRQFWLFAVVQFYKVAVNTEPMNTEPFLLGKIQG